MLGRAVLRLARLLASRPAAVLAMSLMAATLMLAALTPDPEIADPGRLQLLRVRRPIVYWIISNLRPHQVAASRAFLLLPTYLFVAIGYSIFNRVRAKVRHRDRRWAVSGRFRVTRSLALDGGVPQAQLREAALWAVKHHRYRVVSDRAASAGESGSVDDAAPPVRGERGRIGFVGSLTFHLGLLVVLVGAVLSTLTRAEGEVIATEGFSTPLGLARSYVYLRNGNRFPSLRRTFLTIRNFYAIYSRRGTPVDYALLLAIKRDKRRVVERQVRVNQSLTWRGLVFSLQRWGYAPVIAASGPKSWGQLAGTARMRKLSGRWRELLTAKGGGQLRIQLFPDAATRKKKLVSRSQAPRSPLITFKFFDRAGKAVAKGRVRQGQTTIVKGYRLRFAGLDHWAGFTLTMDYGVWVVLLGAILGTVGLVTRWLAPDQSIELGWQLGDDGVTIAISAGARFFPALHEQAIDRLADELMQRLGDGATEKRETV